MSILAAAVVRPAAGRALDARRLSTRNGLLTGLVIAAAGLAAAMLSGLTGVLSAAALIGVGTGLITPPGFAALAAPTRSNAWDRPGVPRNWAASSAT
ncbi:hypothetical protein [Lentzea terrae]|uniref:hypothetical protein n=1 Tax=Lentzea terrae TaxID=2200761 RepID=UPI0018E4FC1A|nr:hypothetical protein [Lentzea terrae]